MPALSLVHRLSLPAALFLFLLEFLPTTSVKISKLYWRRLRTATSNIYTSRLFNKIAINDVSKIGNHAKNSKKKL
jgi:hypothetical protein